MPPGAEARRCTERDCSARALPGERYCRDHRRGCGAWDPTSDGSAASGLPAPVKARDIPRATGAAVGGATPAQSIA